MHLVTALAIVIGAMGGLATYVYLGPLAPYGLAIWATFIAWASFFHCGGNEAALRNSIFANLWGALCATVGLVLVTQISLGALPVTAGVWVGVSVAVMILGAHVPLFGAIPAAVYGYASTAAFALLADKLGTLLGGGLGTNPFLTIGASMIIGNLLGYVSGKIAGSLAK